MNIVSATGRTIETTLINATRKVNDASAAAYSGKYAEALGKYAEAGQMFREVQDNPEATETQRDIAAEGLDKLVANMARHAA